MTPDSLYSNATREGPGLTVKVEANVFGVKAVVIIKGTFGTYQKTVIVSIIFVATLLI